MLNYIGMYTPAQGLHVPGFLITSYRKGLLLVDFFICMTLDVSMFDGCGLCNKVCHVHQEKKTKTMLY